MLRLMLKTDYWDAEDAGMLSRTSGDLNHFTIKNMQDAVVMKHLDGTVGKDVLEVGGGHSRVLGYFCQANRCTNVDPLEGEHGGPTGQRENAPYKQVFATIGNSRDVLPDQSFDVIFSISVVEHVLERDLGLFFADLARILRPGGRMVHLIDTYLGVDPPESAARRRTHRIVDWFKQNLPLGAFTANTAMAVGSGAGKELGGPSTTLSKQSSTPLAGVNDEPRSRLRGYRRAFESGLFRPTVPTQVMTVSEVNFHPRVASNPDNIMNEWNQMAPSLREIRAEAQACSFILDAIRL